MEPASAAAAAAAAADDWFADDPLMWAWHVEYSANGQKMWGWPTVPLETFGPRWDV